MKCQVTTTSSSKVIKDTIKKYRNKLSTKYGNKYSIKHSTKYNTNKHTNHNTKYKRCNSAGGLHTSPASAATSLILVLCGICSICSIGLVNVADTYATESTISLTIDDSIVDMNISPTNTNGTFNKSGSSTITASTTNATGYTLSIAASNSTDLVNTSDSSSVLESISEATTEDEFKALEGTSYNGMWGYLPSKYAVYSSDGVMTIVDNTGSNPDFLPAPTTSGDTINVTSCANGTTNCPNEEDTYTIAIGARVDSTTKVGAYSNTFVILATGAPITYSIFYNDTTITNMPSDINTGATTLESVNISSNTPKKSGYTFIGWCTAEPTTSGLTDTCPSTATQYSPNDPYVLDQTATSNTLALYTMWKRNTMQNVADWKDSVGIGEETTAVDTRDGNVYSVARLCMSKPYVNGETITPNECYTSTLWMTQNLDLKIGPAGSEVLTSETSDISKDLGTTQGYSTSSGVITWTPKFTANVPAIITSHTSDGALTGWTDSNNKLHRLQ